MQISIVIITTIVVVVVNFATIAVRFVPPSDYHLQFLDLLSPAQLARSPSSSKARH